MYLHKENRELFRDAILLASQKLEVSEDIVEKDYYVTLILKKFSSAILLKRKSFTVYLLRHSPERPLQLWGLQVQERQQ